MPTQKTYIFNSTTSGLNFNASSQKWTIASGVFVGSGSSEGVYSGYDGSKLINKGHIHSDSAYGVEFFSADNTAIVNKASGDIYGHTGIFDEGQNYTITNDGTIIGSTDYGIWDYQSDGASITNDGEIYGHIFGIDVHSNLVGAHGTMIDNAGSIFSDSFGVYVNTNAGEKTKIVNEHGGTIKGGTFSTYVVSGKLDLHNHGTMVHEVLSAGANDKVVNDGTIKGSVNLGGGNDTYKSNGGHAGKIDGGLGNDTLIGGSHVDKFVFDTLLNAATNVDTVKHFTPGTDQFFLSTGIFTALTGPGTLKKSEFHIGKHAHDGNDYIIYSQHNGGLYYDADGNGSTYSKVKFAELDKGLHLHHGDFIVFA